MKLINFDKYKQNNRAYGGSAGQKLGITLEDGRNLMLKFPGNLRNKGMRNIVLSYSNSPVSEYIGSKIYESFGIPVHNVCLGTRNGKIVVACEDFLGRGERLLQFREIKVTTEEPLMDSKGSYTDGSGVDLQEIIQSINTNEIFSDMQDVEARFWDMFVVDALIGNPDRNNENWGIIVDMSDEKRLAPVFDNGNCLNSKWDDERMQAVLSDPKQIKSEGYHAKRCIFELNDKKINPYHYIMSKQNENCNEAVKRIVPKLSFLQYKNLIDEIPCISDTQKVFYLTMLASRIENVLIPTYRDLMQRGNSIDVNISVSLAKNESEIYKFYDAQETVDSENQKHTREEFR